MSIEMLMNAIEETETLPEIIEESGSLLDNPYIRGGLVIAGVGMVAYSIYSLFFRKDEEEVSESDEMETVLDMVAEKTGTSKQEIFENLASYIAACHKNGIDVPVPEILGTVSEVRDGVIKDKTKKPSSAE